MNIKMSITFVAFMVLSCNVFAYGSSSSKKACKKPKFTDFTPTHLTEVEPQSEFSFKTSDATNPDTIKIIIKKQVVDIELTPVNGGYKISGNLPEALKQTHARINIKATGTNRCKGSDGWLLKIK